MISAPNMFRFWARATLLFSLIFWFSLVVAIIFDRENMRFFLMMGLLSTSASLAVLWLTPQQERIGMHGVQCFIEIFTLWHLLGFLGALPFYYLLGRGNLLDCFYEAVSGLTTTGIELFDVATMPASLLFYHQALEFLGGIGIVVFLLAIFPERFQHAAKLFNVEVTGPDGAKQFLVRISTSARAFAGLYIGLSIGCILLFYLAGMPMFFAICESFGVISTGGFSIHADGLIHYNSANILIIAIVFMLLGSLSFRSHYLFFIRRLASGFFNDYESRVYLQYIGIVIGLLYLWLIVADIDVSARVKWLYQVAGMLTTTGVYAEGLVMPDWMLYVLTILSCIGGCAGSTAGGIKFARLLYLGKQFKRSLLFFINRHQVLAGDLPNDTSISLQGLGAVILWSYLAFSTLMMMAGASFADAMQLTVSSLSCVGAMLFHVVQVAELSSLTKFLSLEGMIAGRMELIVFWVIFSLQYWRK